MKLVLVRHGQSNANVRQIVQGWGDDPLSELGLAQAEKVANRLASVEDVRAIYCSPLLRARQTAEAIARRLSLEPQPEPDLREINFGLIEGLSMEEFKIQFPDVYAAWQGRKGVDFRWPNGESRSEFWTRVIVAVERIIAAHSQGTVIVVAHSGALATYVSQIVTGEPGRWTEYGLDNCSVTELEANDGTMRLLLHNDCTHLDHLKA
jgi:probable phosphoglycerate mutase